MRTFYVLIDSDNGMHYGYTFDEEKARKERDKLEDEHGVQIDIYEFKSYEEF
jgi:hypothetical protein